MKGELNGWKNIIMKKHNAAIVEDAMIILSISQMKLFGMKVLDIARNLLNVLIADALM